MRRLIRNHSRLTRLRFFYFIRFRAPFAGVSVGCRPGECCRSRKIVDPPAGPRCMRMLLSMCLCAGAILQRFLICAREGEHILVTFGWFFHKRMQDYSLDLW